MNIISRHLFSKTCRCCTFSILILFSTLSISRKLLRIYPLPSPSPHRKNSKDGLMIESLTLAVSMLFPIPFLYLIKKTFLLKSEKIESFQPNLNFEAREHVVRKVCVCCVCLQCMQCVCGGGLVCQLVCIKIISLYQHKIFYYIGLYITKMQCL